MGGGFVLQHPAVGGNVYLLAGLNVGELLMSLHPSAVAEAGAVGGGSAFKIVHGVVGKTG